MGYHEDYSDDDEDDYLQSDSSWNGEDEDNLPSDGGNHGEFEHTNEEGIVVPNDTNY